ncbi:hypothetical protein HY468_00015, partial [Candidatus Roizmanbacteria bacterium]|nr:hypothetical protein [Candidatus Roizmanbacteria bacterium]
MQPPVLPDKPAEIIATMQKKGFECYVVGGSVRNLLMHRPTHNWDFTTNATPKQLLVVFKDNSFHNNQFGTVGVKVTEED